MKKIEVIFYNVSKNEFTKETIENLDDYYKLLKCSLFDVVRLDNNINLYVDDEGLLKSGNLVSDIKYKDYESKLVGNIIITGGIDSKGNSLSCSIDINTAKEIIKFNPNYIVK